MLRLRSPNGRALLRATHKNDLFKLHGYEPKKYYFQAVSNSSWADRHAGAMLRELGEVCDDYLEGDSAVGEYLRRIALGEVAEGEE